MSFLGVERGVEVEGGELRVEGLLSSNIPKLEDREGRSFVVMVANERHVARKAIGGLPRISNGTGLV